MLENNFIMGQLEEVQQRRAERRRFMKLAATGAAAVGGLSLLAACGNDNNDGGISATPTPTSTALPTTTAEQDVLNFALNLEYLEAQFYSFAATGVSLPVDQLSGTGTQGAPQGGRKVNFTDPLVARYANEIAADEAAHVKFLRTALGSVAVSQPALNIDGGTTGAFTAAASAAGIPLVNGGFDPYASDENFLLAAFIFEDVGVTAYKGSAAALINNKIFLEAAAGLAAVEAYHAGLIRTVLYRKGMDTTSLRTNADKFSDARDSLDGTTDLDQGISPVGDVSNIVPTDSNGLTFSRTPGQVLNIVYLNKTATTSGGFFPRGVNGKVMTSAASG